MPMNAQQAIERSVTYDETVTFDATEADLLALYDRCEDFADVRGQYGWVELWGTDGDRSWRVHARLEAP